MANGFTYPALPVVTMEHPDMIEFFRWGLIPHWAKDMASAVVSAKNCLNAISEEIAQKSSFRAVQNKRCAIFVTGFYELRHFKGKAYPYFIKQRERDYFWLGGLYSHWKDPETDFDVPTVTVLTTRANPLMEIVHNERKRMPVILTDELLGVWLSDRPTEAVKALMEPYDQELMEAYSISKLLTSRKDNNNVPEVQDRFDYPELAVQKTLF